MENLKNIKVIKSIADIQEVFGEVRAKIDKPHNPKFVQKQMEVAYVKPAEKPMYKQLVIRNIRKRYDINDEIALLKKDKNDPDYLAYIDYVNESKQLAKTEAEIIDNEQ